MPERRQNFRNQNHWHLPPRPSVAGAAHRSAIRKAHLAVVLLFLAPPAANLGAGGGDFLEAGLVGRFEHGRMITPTVSPDAIPPAQTDKLPACNRLSFDKCRN